MALSGPRSGKHAVFTKGGTAVDSITRWSMNAFFTPEDVVHSASYGGHIRLAGVYDWNATVEGFGGYPGLFPGEKFAAEFFTAPDTGVYGAAGMMYYGNCIVDSLTINWDWNAGGVMRWSANVSSNGCLSESAVGDEVDVPSSCHTGICGLFPSASIACAADSFVEIPNVLSASLAFTSDNQAYSNSSTDCCTYREAGNLDYTLEFTDQETNVQLTEATYYKVRMYVSGTTYWLLNGVLYSGVSNLSCDVESGAIISKSNTLSMSGMYCCSDVQTVGSIVDPGTVTKWPIAPS